MKPNENISLQSVFDCLSELNYFMTKVLVFGRPECASILSKTLHPLTITVGTCAQNLGVIFNPVLKFDNQISSVVKSALF
ncbi:Fibrous sheath-interacting protein 1 [Labeo rohita]|uniref:Fibrous sheath-interacting protein 1 n=1 Tax=Labeo rohita TaxID=84645 RepID=A0ABQ8LV33_LABRO|nr:Fibrous sheath-interacting protein 1 [Labeo rohita]